jgi:hypothetical protein
MLYFVNVSETQRGVKEAGKMDKQAMEARREAGRDELRAHFNRVRATKIEAKTRAAVAARVKDVPPRKEKMK